MGVIKVFMCLAAFVAICNGQNGGELNSRCTNNNECISGLTCRENSCLCPKGKKLSGYSDKAANCILVLGAGCDGDDDCSAMNGAICDHRKCACSVGINAGAFECIPEIIDATATCVEHSQCIHAFGEFSTCIKNARCTCKEQYYLNEDQRECVKTKGILENCHKDEECYLNVDNQNALACRQNNCNCTEGFRYIGDTCESGAPLTVASVTLMLFTAMGILRLWSSSLNF